MVRITQEYGYSDVADVAQRLVALSASYPIITFKGPIGAGKTTLIRSLLRQMGVTDPITSPTFTYVSCYLTKDVKRIYHFDLYRIETAAQFDQMGFDEYLYEPDALVLIEWPSILAKSLKKPVCAVTLDYAPNQEKRIITIVAPLDPHDL